MWERRPRRELLNDLDPGTRQEAAKAAKVSKASVSGRANAVAKVAGGAQCSPG
jgi:hypothetical protein